MITFDAQASLNQVALSSTWTLSHTIGSGSDRYLQVYAAHLLDGGVGPTSVKYNGVDMNLVKVLNDNAGSGYTVFIYNLVAPTVGANNVVVVWPNTYTGQLGTSSWLGVDQSSPNDGAVNATGTGGGGSPSFSNSITTTYDNDMVVDYAISVNGITPTQTSIGWTNQQGGAQGSYQLTTTAGIYTNGWNGAFLFKYADIIVGIKESTASPVVDNSLFFAGD